MNIKNWKKISFFTPSVGSWDFSMRGSDADQLLKSHHLEEIAMVILDLAGFSYSNDTAKTSLDLGAFPASYICHKQG